MKERFYLLRFIAILACFISSTQCVRGDVILSVSPTTQLVSIGSAVSIDVNVSGLGNGAAPSIGTFDVLLTFNPSLLSYTSVGWGSGLDVLSLGSLQSETPGLGNVNLFELSFDSATDLNALQPDAFRMFTVNFMAIGTGTSDILLGVNALGDADGISITHQIGNGSVTVQDAGSAVPEPGTMGIVAIALFALCCGSRRRVFTVFTQAARKSSPSVGC